METQQINLKLYDELNDWDPFQLGYGHYDTEIADTIQAVHELDAPSALAKRIQGIYEFSFEEFIPMENCLKIARDLLIIKSSESCSL
ncbi:DUF1871 family protein [Neobacillus sp. PS3-34]|uniref:DUF1871 family protein n=1 Tax=Neobacillus sp. PS3-34 TaxID=3070678 RepID=UPI0027DF96E5|nr:DUF1871 family protein [Neobacillus sp. PS3-34]WML47103.1 DUF1871 family protein [Neobacillus sp. PS3-34]